MKRKIINSITILACMVSISYAQTNLDFETWGPSTYGSSDPTGWTTFNLDLLGFPISTFQETANPGLGLSSVRMVTTAGYMGFFGVDIIGGVANQVVPYTDKPISVDFLYKSNISTTDTGWFRVTLRHWDGTQRVVDAEAEMKFSGTPVTSWTTASLPFQYYTSNTPDTIDILMASSIYVPAPAAGSELQIDNIVFNTSSCPTPTAGFTYSSSGLGLTCVDASSVTGTTTYVWVFGDGSGTSTSQSPSYTYATSGTYNVCLTLVDSCGSDTVCQSVTVVAPCPTPTAGFTYSSSGLAITCTDASNITGTTTYSWDFGDGSGTSTLQNTGYIYAASGTYNVCLTLVDSCGTDSICQSVTVIDTLCPDPTAGFTSGVNGLAITCTDASSITGTASYSWDFGDGLGVSTQQNPGYIYSLSGVYDVCLAIADSCGTDTICQTVSVVDTSCPPPTADYNYAVNGLDVVFLNSYGADTYTIGVNSSNSMDYTFSGDVSGLDPSFDVTIGDTIVFNVNASGHPFWLKTIQGTGQSNSVPVSNNGTSSGTIIWVPTTAGTFSYNCEFHSGMTGIINVLASTTSFVWDFGDGTGTSVELNPSYTYATSGTYNVCLTVTDSCGTDSVCQNVMVTSISVGISDAINEQVISVYPNPTQSIVYFNKTLNDPVMVYVYNGMGSLVQSFAIDDREKKLNVESYSEGIYFYRVLGRRPSDIFYGCFAVSK